MGPTYPAQRRSLEKQHREAVRKNDPSAMAEIDKKFEALNQREMETEARLEKVKEEIKAHDLKAAKVNDAMLVAN